MECCRSQFCEGANRFFTRWSRRYARQFRKKGPDKIQKMILEGIGARGSSSRHVLDIGCGVGSLHLTLLKQGAGRATGIDVSNGMLAEARKLSTENNLSHQTQYIEGDFVQVADQVEQSDITLLDKVVCCYDDVESLLHASLEKTTTLYAVSHPRDSILIKPVYKTQIFFARLFRSAFFPYWHDWGALRTTILSRGFVLRYENASFLWSVLVFERTTGKRGNTQ